MIRHIFVIMQLVRVVLIVQHYTSNFFVTRM